MKNLSRDLHCCTVVIISDATFSTALQICTYNYIEQLPLDEHGQATAKKCALSRYFSMQLAVVIAHL